MHNTTTLGRCLASHLPSAFTSTKILVVDRLV